MEEKIANGTNVQNDLKIVNGTTISDNLSNQFNFLASIVPKGKNKPFCGGAFIGKNVVLTAAHCVDGVNADQIQVQFKKKYSNSSGITFNVKKILIHPNYNSITANNDIALIFLRGRPWKKGIRPLYLPSNKLQRTIYRPNKRSFIMGFGSTFSGGGMSNTLKYAIIKNMRLNQTDYPSEWITPNMVIMGDYRDINNPNDNIDTCQGDSGTSSFGRYGSGKRPVAMGITSWGIGCALDGYPGVYTKTGNYIQWIYSKTRIGTIN